ncbi:MAG TPA: ribosome biogenesis factor YjgA [Usitatibacteraceae bacterium]|nr:ribosome biogenesis factor YjgA [Usitatibacteraceae bacterium]
MSAQDENVISKSQVKRDMEALQKLGEQLAGLSNEALARFELPEELRGAIAESKKIAKSKFGAQKRQMQYIGRLMREVDAAPIAEQLAALKAPGHKQTAQHHAAERWRERLLADESALAAFAREYPSVDSAQLAQCLAAARAEHAKGQPPKHFRRVYQLIHHVLTAQPA